jgi:excisionase family DNA binding protein
MTAKNLTIAQAARRLGVSESSLRSMIQTKKLRVVRGNDHQLLVRVDDLAKVPGSNDGSRGKRRAVRTMRP